MYQFNQLTLLCINYEYFSLLLLYTRSLVLNIAILPDESKSERYIDKSVQKNNARKQFLCFNFQGSLYLCTNVTIRAVNINISFTHLWLSYYLNGVIHIILLEFI